MSRMGSSKQQSNMSQTTNFAEMGEEEKALVKRMSELGVDQADALKYVMEQGRAGGGPTSSLALTSQDQATLDEAYGGAEANLRRFGNLMGQDLAGTRGLNPSDTPVSEAVLRETLPAYQQLMSQKAQQSLGLGLNMRQMNEGARQFNLQSVLGGATSMPTALGFNLQNMLRERMGRSTTTGSNTSYNNDSILSMMNQGAQFRNTMHAGTNQATQAGGNVMKGIAGFM